MNKIKFSHKYKKLAGQTKATLMFVAVFDYEKDRYPSLTEYDTAILEGGYYPLSKGRYVILFFLGDKGIPFTTIRSKIGRFGLDKEEYYSKHLNEEFEIVVEES